MKQHIIQPDDVAPGLITYDDLELDLHVPLAEQRRALKDDMLQVYFPNGCILDVSYLPALSASGQFYVALSQQGPNFVRLACKTLEELRELVVELAREAAKRPWVPHGLFRPEQVHPGLISENLVLDPQRPLAEQCERLGRGILRVVLDDYLMLRVDWLPEHAPDGEFHVTVKQWELVDPPDPTVHVHRTCKSIAELREIIKEVVQFKSKKYDSNG